MGTDVFDPDNDTMPDFCRDVLGMEPTPLDAPPEALFTSNSVLLLIFGLLAGLFAGFSIGVSANTTLVSGR